MSVAIDADLHNFGRKCFLKNGFIYKPRSIQPELSLYSSDSYLRRYVEGFYKFTTLPFLSFDLKNNDISLDYNGMEYIQTTGFLSRMSDQDSESIGATVALLNLLGVVDLHETNFVFGIHKSKPVFAPIDLECFFQRYTLAKSDFLPYIRSFQDYQSGVSHFLHYSKEHDSLFFLKFIFGYVNFYEKMLNSWKKLHENFVLDQSREPYTRIIFRDTTDYYIAQKDKNYEGFHEDEIAQLKRGDIPYFFQIMDKSGMFLWENSKNYSFIGDSLNEFYKLKKGFNYKGPKAIPKSDLVLFLSLFAVDLPFKANLGYKNCLLVKEGEECIVKVDNKFFKFNPRRILNCLPN